MTDDPTTTDPTPTDAPNNGTPPEAAAEAEDQEQFEATIDGLTLRRVVDLPESGHRAHVHTVLGKHARKARLYMDERSRNDQMSANFYLLMQVVTLDGKRVGFDDIENLPFSDLNLLLGAADIMEASGPLESSTVWAS
jgi:hypothetical protein